MKRYEFNERIPQVIEDSEIMHHISSRGHPVDIHVQSKYLTAGMTTIPPGERLGRMAAHGGDEVYYIVSGTATVECARHEAEHTVETGQIFHIPAGQIHAPRNDTAEDLVIFWVTAPDWP